MRQIELYTAQEQEFLKGTLNLLGVDYAEAEGHGPISSVIFSFVPNASQERAIGHMLKANFEANYTHNQV
jgi:hypothetical protein